MNNVGRALVKKKVLKLGSDDIETMDNSNVYDTYSEKECEERLLQCIQSVKRLKARVGAKKADVITNQENAIKKTFDKRFLEPSGFDFS